MGLEPRREPTERDWADALLTSGTEALLGAVRNYLGPVRTPYDKRDLVRRLEAFVRRAETRAAMVGLLDPLDARILGTCLLVGPATEAELKGLFLGELPLFEIGLRLSNLVDRLLVFRYCPGSRRLLAVNPLLVADLESAVAGPELVFGAGAGAEGEARAGACDAAAAAALFSFLFHSPSSLRKGGGLTKRAQERAVALFRGLGPGWESGAAERLDTMARALALSGSLRAEGDSWVADRAAFAALAGRWGEALPFLLAALLARPEPAREPALEGGEEGVGIGGGGPEDRGAGESAEGERGAVERAEGLALLLERAHGALPEGLALPRQGMARWLRILALRDANAAARRGPGRPDALGDPSAALPFLEALGVPRARPRRPAAAAPGAPVLVAEGAHALHLLPEAGLAERILVGALARPSALGRVWSFELDRETARAGFASGLDAATASERMEALSGRVLPQSLSFSLRAWEEEYRSVRLYRGLVLVVDERHRAVMERGVSTGAVAAERLAEGVYFLRARGREEASEELARVGLELPGELSSGSARAVAAVPAPLGGRIDAMRDLEEALDLGATRDLGAGATGPVPVASATGPVPVASATGPVPVASALDPEPRLAALRAALAASGRPADEARELEERISRRLVLTEEQIARSDPRSERMEAAGLDYLGKVRVVERSLRSPGDRLEVLYRLSGAEPVRALLRPVRLEKNEKGLVLEAEDLATGGPARVPLGAVSTVRRVRASLFGDEA